MATGMLAGEIEELLTAGDVAGALAEAGRRRDAAPEIEAFAALEGRAQATAARLHAADVRVHEVGSSLLEYDRAATLMVAKANARMEAAEAGEEEAKAKAVEVAGWEQVAEQREETYERVQSMWQNRAIRKMRASWLHKCLDSWSYFTEKARVHRKAVIRMGSKFSHRVLHIAVNGWRKFVRLAVVETAREQVEAATAAEAEARRAQAQAESERDAALEQAAKDREQLEEKEAQLQTQVERRDEADKAAAAAKEQYREEYAKRVAVEQAQQDTRRTWAAEKRKRESIEQELVVLQGRFEEREAEMRELEEAYNTLRRQSIASRYDAWSGRKVGAAGEEQPRAVTVGGGGARRRPATAGSLPRLRR